MSSLSPQRPPYLHSPSFESVTQRETFEFDEPLPCSKKRSLSLDLTNLLDGIKAIYIKQQFESLEALTGFETENVYSIYSADPMRQKPLEKLVIGQEKSNICMRQNMSESMRSFKMDFSDVRTKRKLIHIDKPFRFTFFGYNRPEMYIYDYQNKNMLIGTIRIPFRFDDHQFQIFNEQNQLVYNIIGDCFQIGFWCKQCPFDRCQNSKMLIRNVQNQVVGNLNKKSAGFFKSLISDCDNYFIDFPQNCPIKHKYLIIACAIFIDYWIFEGKHDSTSIH